jgi:hypothetical protein
MNDINTTLEVVDECPLFDLYKGECSKCRLFKGTTDIYREGKCNALELYRPISDFMEPRKCPKKYGVCIKCPSFLGFKDDRGFYCNA